MAEPMIPGRELTVAVLNGQPLTVTEITPSNHFYDYEAKYASGGSRHQLPAEVPDHVAEQAMAGGLALIFGVPRCQPVRFPLG